MRKSVRSLLAGASMALALGCGFALGQVGVTSPTLTGNEAWQVGQGIGGASFFVTTAQMRNATGITLTALVTGALTIAPITADLIQTTALSGAFAVTAPPIPFDGEIFEYVNGSAGANVGTMTFTANAGQTVQSGGVVNLAQFGSAEWRYVQSTLTWYRLR